MVGIDNIDMTVLSAHLERWAEICTTVKLIYIP